MATITRLSNSRLTKTYNNNLTNYKNGYYNPKVGIAQVTENKPYYTKYEIDKLLREKEDKINKSKAITSASTDVEYASSKSVYDYVQFMTSGATVPCDCKPIEGDDYVYIKNTGNNIKIETDTAENNDFANIFGNMPPYTGGGNSDCDCRDIKGSDYINIKKTSNDVIIDADTAENDDLTGIFNTVDGGDSNVTNCNCAPLAGDEYISVVKEDNKTQLNADVVDNTVFDKIINNIIK